jgi:hypothetical protein
MTSAKQVADLAKQMALLTDKIAKNKSKCPLRSSRFDSHRQTRLMNSGLSPNTHPFTMRHSFL